MSQMKNNTQTTKALLQRALLDTPQDFALSEVRYHIRAALGKLEQVEKKRDKRQVQLEKRQEVRAEKAASFGLDPFKQLQAIDDLIAEEKAKIAEIQRRRTAQPEKGEDDGDLQAVLG
jgi:hypothetical protein